MESSWVQVESGDGGTFRAYYVLPQSGSGPAIVLLQEIFGVNGHIRDLARHFASHGFIVIAPDLYWRLHPELELGYSPDEVAVALDHYARLDMDQAVLDMGATIRFVVARPECNGRVAAMGFCLGGYLAIRCALAHDVQAAVSYYGVGVDRHLDAIGNLRLPVMLHYAEMDQFIPATTVEAVKTSLSDHPSVQVYTYPDVDHAFVNSQRPEFDRAAADLSEARTLQLFDRALFGAEQHEPAVTT